MTPQHQAFRHDPDNGVYGDCARTAFATLLGVHRDDVPHFAHDWPTGEVFWQRISDWLRERGLRYFILPLIGELSSIRATIAAMNGEDVAYIMGGTSPRGTGHFVVCRGSELFSDPSPEGGDIPEPIDGFYEVILLTHLSPSA